MGKPVFDILTSTADTDYFLLKAGNGEPILTSQMYVSMSGLLSGIASVIENSQRPEAYKTFIGEDGKYYFNLRAKNNKVIGTSEAYNWKVSRWFGMRSVRVNAPKAFIQANTSVTRISDK